MSKHTPEPWIDEAPYIAAMVLKGRPNGEIIGRFGGYTDSTTNVADARRAVACVNALAGVEEPQAYLADLLRRIGDLEAALELREQQWQELTMAAGVAHYGSFGCQIANAHRRSEELDELRILKDSTNES